MTHQRAFDLTQAKRFFLESKIAEDITKTLPSNLKSGNHWPLWEMTKQTGLSYTTTQRIWESIRCSNIQNS